MAARAKTLAPRRKASPTGPSSWSNASKSAAAGQHRQLCPWAMASARHLAQQKQLLPHQKSVAAAKGVKPETGRCSQNERKNFGSAVGGRLMGRTFMHFLLCFFYLAGVLNMNPRVFHLHQQVQLDFDSSARRHCWQAKVSSLLLSICSNTSGGSASRQQSASMAAFVLTPKPAGWKLK